MKKIITLLAAVALSVSFLSAQNARRAVGDMSLDLGVGINLANNGYSIMFPPIDASFEYTVLDFGAAGTLSAAGVATFGMDKYKSLIDHKGFAWCAYHRPVTTPRTGRRFTSPPGFGQHELRINLRNFFEKLRKLSRNFLIFVPGLYRNMPCEHFTTNLNNFWNSPR